MNKITTVSLFCGGGGLDLGFSALPEIDLVLSTDIDPHSCNTILMNQRKKCFPCHPVITEDIFCLTGDRIKSISSCSQIDLVIGGPPCQSFSVAGKRNADGETLLNKFCEIVQDLNPQVFLLENVPGLKTVKKGSVFYALMNKLNAIGNYACSYYELQAADFGVPQQRKRLFIVGTQKKSSSPLVIKPLFQESFSPLFSEKDLPIWRNTRDALKGLPTNPPIDQRLASVNGHFARQHTEKMRTLYNNLKPGERPVSGPRCNRANINKPAFTVMSASSGGGGNTQIHPFEPRMMTPREIARIQSFPDWWEFSGKRSHMIRQIGNAVPPLMAYNIAIAILFHLTGIVSQHRGEQVLGLHYQD